MSEEGQALTPATVTDAPVNTEVDKTAADGSGTTEPVVETEEEQQVRKLADDKKKGEKARYKLQRRFDEYAQTVRDKDGQIQKLVEALTGRQQQPQNPQQTDQPPTREQFGSYEDWLEAKSAYTSEKRMEAKLTQALSQMHQQSQAANNQQMAAQVLQQYTKNISDFEAKTPDFREVVDRDDVSVPNDAVRAIAQLPDSALILYAIGKNPDLANELWRHQGNPTMQTYVLAQIAAAAKASPQRSNAPRPGTPVGSRGGSAKDPKHMTRDEYYAHITKKAKK